MQNFLNQIFTPYVKSFLEHLLKLAAAAAASVVLVNILQLLNHFQIASLPLQYQGLAYLLLPVIVQALVSAKTYVDSVLSQQKLAEANTKITTLQTQLVAKSEELDNTKGLLSKLAPNK